MRPPSESAAPPLTIRLFFLPSWLLGWWLVLDGLYQRLLGEFPRLGGQAGWVAELAGRARIDPLDLGWPLVVLGLTLISASFGLWLRRGWGFNVGLAAAALGLLYLGPGTLLALVCLVLLLLPPTRRYLRAQRAPAPP